jgi:parvulin-like peptidyl-prolyl isomerase
MTTAKWSDVSQVSLGRSLTISGVAALIGLGLAGFALFTAKGTSTLVVPPEDVALVNQQPIARSDFELQLRAIYGAVDITQLTPAQRKSVLDSMIREELFVQRGKELDVASVDSDVRQAMVAAVEAGIAADVMASQPSEEKLRAYYEAHKDEYSNEGIMTARDLVFPASTATQAYQALSAGQKPDAVEAQFMGKDSGKLNGEEFYFAAKIHLGDALFALARPLAAGAVSKPAAQPDGVHIIYMVANRPPVALAFEEAYTRVRGDYQKAAVTRVQAADEGFFRKRANVLIASDLKQ